MCLEKFIYKKKVIKKKKIKYKIETTIEILETVIKYLIFIFAKKKRKKRNYCKDSVRILAKNTLFNRCQHR